jgi:Tfp pilus assembly protein PilF
MTGNRGVAKRGFRIVSPIVAALVLSTTMVKAAPAAAPETTGGFAAHMKRGRELAHAKKWRAALAELEAAVAAAPKDPGAWSELGWVALQAGDLARAGEASQAAVDLAVDPKLKAASLYKAAEAAAVVTARGEHAPL